MAEKDWLLGETPNPLSDRVAEIREKLRDKNPEELAAYTGATYLSKGQGREFQLPFWSRDVIISFPDFVGCEAGSGEELNSFDMTMLAYYFDVSNSVPLAGEWIAFKQIPGGMFYAQAFQGYTGDNLLKVFGDDLEAFIKANEKLGGRREVFGNAAFSYQILPHVPIMVVCWLGDEDFDSSYRMLFDASAHHHLVTDAYAILGSNLTKKLIKAKG
ncbi:MAG: DUF3786 domain-containing protein [Anaerolineae bacterium]|jgi:hypothetical protein|nr:DUF3786 domain-containing protein [Anaerolineae bacterium]MBT7189263.1 DUF3786 domain-containing protein [Anaerolineae bacterium]MBT7990111.1 DUF3786 domain-containing protein [Anaerolineae bacterium]